MEITHCGFDMQHSSGFKVLRPTGLGEYLLLIMRSPVCVIVNEKTHYTKGHSVILFHKDTPHFFAADNKPYINDWIQFQADEADLQFLSEISLKFDTLIEYADAYVLSRLVKQICTERGSNNKNANKSVKLLLELLFLKLSDLDVEESTFSSHLSEQLSILRNNIYSSPQNDWSIDRICKTMSISPSYLQHKYKQMFHTGIKRDITLSRLELSRHLLSNTALSIAEISRRVGYENDVHFMRVFKKETGFTPSQYRKSDAAREQAATYHPQDPWTVNTDRNN